MNVRPLKVSQGQICVFKQSVNEKKLMKFNMLVENGWFSVILHQQTGFVHNYTGSLLRRT